MLGVFAIGDVRAVVRSSGCCRRGGEGAQAVVALHAHLARHPRDDAPGRLESSGLRQPAPTGAWLRRRVTPSARADAQERLDGSMRRHLRLCRGACGHVGCCARAAALRRHRGIST